MITKKGYAITGLANAGLGAFRADELTAAEEAALRRQYGLDPDANLTLRNAGRGLAGGVAGGMAGGAVGHLLASDAEKFGRVVQGRPTSFLGRTFESIVNVPADVKRGVKNVGRVANGKAPLPMAAAPNGRAGAVLKGARILLPMAGHGLGAVAGSIAATNKYTKDTARQIMRDENAGAAPVYGA